jgi:hypothetical protein
MFFEYQTTLNKIMNQALRFPGLFQFAAEKKGRLVKQTRKTKLIILCAALSMGLNAQTLDEILNKRAPQTTKKDQNAGLQWNDMLSAFAANDEEKACELANGLLGEKQILTPLQIRATQMLVQLSKHKSSSESSLEIAQLKKDASEALVGANYAEQQLARVLAEGAQLPKQFTAGGQTHQKWIHLSNQDKAFTETRDSNRKKFEELKARYELLTKKSADVLEDDIIQLATLLSEDNQIEGAMALCSIYIRKNPPAEKVVIKGQELVLLKEAFTKASGLLKAVETTIRKLMAEKKVWAAQEELVKSKQMIESKIEDQNEKKAFAKLVIPLSEELSRVIDSSKIKAAEVSALAKTDAEEAVKQLAVLRTTAVDLPEIESINVSLNQTNRMDQSAAYEKRLQVIRDLALSDLNAAKGLLNDLQKGLSGEDALILNAQLVGARRGLWVEELNLARADIDEAHSFLEKVSSNFLYTLKSGSNEEIRAAMNTYDARENMTRAKGLLTGALKAVSAIPSEELDNVLQARVEGIKAAASASLQEIARAESLTDTSPNMASFLIPISLVVFVAGLIAFVLVRQNVKSRAR